MIDAHFHRDGFAAFLSGEGLDVAFAGIHPWETATLTEETARMRLESVREILGNHPDAAVGEIGLDRLRDRSISPVQRRLFEEQLALAAAFSRPVVLHGAKCWGEVACAAQAWAGKIPSFLFHGFSRSAGLLPTIFRLNGFVSVGPSILNDHAVNYRELVATLPPDRVLVETDLDAAKPEDRREDVLAAVYAKLAELRGLDVAELAAEISRNAARFLGKAPEA